MKWILIIILPLSLFSQSPIEKAYNYWALYQTDDKTFESFQELMLPYLEQKLHINNDSPTRLKAFPLFSFNHANLILQYRSKNGDILLYQELEQFGAFDSIYIQIIRPFISLSPSRNNTNGGTLILRSSQILENKLGYTSKQYQGSPTKHFTKITGYNGNISYGFIWEKDPGEASFKQGNLIKGSIQLENLGPIRSITAGSFNAHLGNGLIHSNNFLIGNNLPTSGTSKNLSSNEENYEQGISIELGSPQINGFVFYSNRALNGYLKNSAFSSFKTDGLFRTNYEKSLIQSARRQSVGVNLKSETIKNTFQINFIRHWLPFPYTPAKRYYNTNYPIPKVLSNGSFAWKNDGEEHQLSNEVAIDQDGNLAYSNVNNLNHFQSFQIKWKNHFISPRFQSLKANSFQLGSRVQNELSSDLTLLIPFSKGRISQSASIYYHPAPKYQTHLPSFQKQLGLKLEYSIKDSTDLLINLRYQNRIKDSTSLNNRFVNNETTYQARMQLKWYPAGNNLMKLNIHYKRVGHFNGYCVSMDIRKSIQKHNFNARLAWINTPNWDTRIYTYENDLLYSFSVPAYYENSFRWYINYSYRFNYHWQFHGKIGQSHFHDKNVVGSGLEEIKGKRRTEIKGQVVFRW